MKIGIDASRYSHKYATGVEWYSYQIINGILGEALKKPDSEVFLYSPADINIPKEFEHPGKVRKIIIPFKRFWTLIRLSWEMRKNPPDVLFVPSHTLPLIRPKFSVITIHDVAFKYLKKSYPLLNYWYLNWSTKYAVKHASKIIAPSEATKNDLIKFFKCPAEKISVVHHGFKKPAKSGQSAGLSENLKFFGFDKKFPYILFVGRLESKKNLARLVEAFKIFAENKSDYRLVLAGKQGFGFEEILEKVRKLGRKLQHPQSGAEVENRVIMPGYVDEDEKKYLYENCEIFAFPSLYEGFGFPVLEAFYYGKPVVTSHVSCLPEVAGDAALYFDPFDVSEIANVLEKLANNKNLRDELVEKGKSRLEKFDLKISIKKTFDILVK